MENHRAILLLGSNLGDRCAALAQARYHLEKEIGQVRQASHLYLSKAWGHHKQAPFFNQILCLECEASPEEVLRRCLGIEKKMGRIRGKRWTSRYIDIDILFYDDLVISLNGLEVPHPRTPERNFTLTALMEVAPQLKHPKMGVTIEELYLRCQDNLDVLMIE